MSSDNDNPKIGISIEQIDLGEPSFGNQPNLDALPILPTRNVVLFPGVTISINLTRPSAIKLVERAAKLRQPIGVVLQVVPDDDKPSLKRGLHSVGTIADILKIIELPEGEKAVLLRGIQAFQIVSAARTKAGYGTSALVAVVDPCPELPPEPGDRAFATIVKNIKKTVSKIMPGIADGMLQMLNSIIGDEDQALLVNTLATNLPLEPIEKQVMLFEERIKERALTLLKSLTKKEEEMELNMDIMNRVRSNMDDEQKRVFLQHQMDVIHEELYGTTDDGEALSKRAAEIKLSEAAKQVFDRELSKLNHINPQNPDYYVIYSYLDTLLSLPWGKESEVNTDFALARQVLDQEHCGLEKVKERILEQLAVLMHRPDGKAPILCLVGPPGVGKTSLGKSIAEAMGREYQRVSLGGMHDEAEIRGHRRTYVGAMPGRILDAVKRAGVANPVLVLDEVDKLGTDYKGDPSSALLEVLDPEQNCHFHDNYVDVDFDLSHVLFMATANTLSTLPKPLLDRMEVINISGYLAEEKQDIARKHLMRRIKSELAIADGEFDISDAAIRTIIDEYTSESGVRQLEKHLATIARKYILAKMSETPDFPAVVEPEHLRSLLGVAPHTREKYEDNSFAGVVTGLAWTEAGGEILLAEASLVPGKGTETVTGNLGNVMKESATIAYQWVKSHASQLGIDTALFEKYNLHVHFPEGAVPKDGPSAGITIATAIVSAFKQTRVRERIAMTGEITLRGKVLPVGGIKEKILAAKRAGITDIVLPADNRKDIEDIAPKYIEGLTFHYMKTALDVMNFAITSEPVEQPLTL